MSTFSLSETLITCPMEPPLEGPPIPVTIDMVKKATCIVKMKSDKATDPSGIVLEMTKAAGNTGDVMIRDLATAIICDGKIPTDWEQSYFVCLYRARSMFWTEANTEQTRKLLERIVDGLIRQVVSIDDSQFRSVPGSGTSAEIFVVRQLQEKYLAVNKRLF